MVHEFHESLSKSHEAEDNPCWVEIYQKAFPNVEAVINHREDGEHQRKGIDRSVILSNSKQILIDEKARFIADTGDVMLEYISNSRTSSAGWVEKPLLADYIAYAFIPSGTAYLFPVLQLQLAWAKHKSEWLSAYGTKRAKNEGYDTLNCPVPIPTVMSKIGKLLRVTFEVPA